MNSIKHRTSTIYVEQEQDRQKMTKYTNIRFSFVCVVVTAVSILLPATTQSLTLTTIVQQQKQIIDHNNIYFGISKNAISTSIISTTTRGSQLFSKQQQQQQIVDDDVKKIDIVNERDINNVMNDIRLKHLEEQAMYALQVAVEQYNTPIFSNALIAGDVVITHLLHRLGYIQKQKQQHHQQQHQQKVQIMVIDTFHLFPSTTEFLHTLENAYNFTAHIFAAKDIPIGNKTAYDEKYGKDLWKQNIDEYDRISKVEPFQRGIQTLNADVVITGRTRWQGAERAWLNILESEKQGTTQLGTLDSKIVAKINPIAYWTLEDVFNYIHKYKIPYHPLHEQGYPSIGDAKDTFPVPDDGSVRFVNYTWIGDKTVWLNYGQERSGRFIGLTNSDGTVKTECGIHVNSADRTWDRDLWEENKSSVMKLHTDDDANKVINSGKVSVVVVYAPWCPFSQRMEEEYEKFAKDNSDKIDVYSIRGDDKREYVMSNLNTVSFPTVNVIKKDGKVIKYDSEIRTVDEFQKFVYDTVEQIQNKNK